MTKAMEYKGYMGSAEVDVDDNLLHGRLLFIRDRVAYAAATPADLKVAFEAAVDDYLETCADLGDEPDVPCKGSFNVRTSPALHKSAALRAHQDGSSLNDVVNKALEAYVVERKDVHHHVNVVVELPEQDIARLVSVASGAPQWTGRAEVTHRVHH